MKVRGGPQDCRGKHWDLAGHHEAADSHGRCEAYSKAGSWKRRGDREEKEQALTHREGGDLDEKVGGGTEELNGSDVSRAGPERVKVAEMHRRGRKEPLNQKTKTAAGEVRVMGRGTEG